MSEPQQPSRDGLVPARSNALTTGSAGLVKRGLDLLARSRAGKKEIRISICGSSHAPSVLEVIRDCIDHYLRDDYHVELTVVRWVDLLIGVKSVLPDVFVLILNSHLYTTTERSDDWHTSLDLTFIANIKLDCQKPVFVFYGGSHLDSDSIFGELVSRGADFASSLPYEPPLFGLTLRTACSLPDVGYAFFSDPDYRAVWVAEAGENYVEMLPYATSLVSRYPHCALAHYWLGKAHERLHHEDDALAAFRQVFKLDPFWHTHDLETRLSYSRG